MTNTTNENIKYLEAVLQDLKDSYNNGEMIEYINDHALDLEYILNSNRQLIGVKIYITLGGPSVWIDTRNNTLNIAWATDFNQIGIFSEICDEITEIFAYDFDF